MKINFQYTALILLLATFQFSSAQKEGEDLGNEVVNVVKPYAPTISDAFKIKETPSLEDEDNSKKEEIKYNIFSFPVASTFTPSKGRAAAVDKTAQERLFKNYVTLAIGNYGNANAELFVTENVGESGYIGGMLRHFSSQGGIKDLVLEDKFSNSALDLTYGYKQSNLSWTADLGYQHQIYYWYGVQQDYFGVPDPAKYNGVDAQHTFHNFYLGSKLALNDSFFKEASFKFNRFWDSFDSAENRFYIKPSFDFTINDTKIKTDLIVDYVGGDFSNNYDDTGAIKYGYTNFGVHPSFVINRSDWTIDLGAAAFYSLDLENSNNKFFVYPEINASLKVVGDLMIFYAGAEGGLDQNSYRDLSNQNPFVSPTLSIAPTDRQYDIFAGLKGKLSSAVSYNVRGSYTSEKNKALFLVNQLPDVGVGFLSDFKGYQLGNSFQLAYDDVKTISFFGELKADFTKNVAFGVNATFNSYKTDAQQEAWNLPALKLATTVDVNITPKWYAGASLFFVGERKDLIQYGIGGTDIATLDSYLDANAHVGFKYNERWTAFLKLNNIANQAYEKWLNYPVQQFQVMLGANYKFDF
ncbi:MAG: TonB-dependent receptor [Flavobacterium sp. BFFFF1]|uniref:TonB-dependent receptor n=1 Tax=Flavobacterium sp. BFFFF1 TaxID=2015557 RepID=UPI000BDB30E3|nr:TonB-dependent receptor [Flavobacterium sp. BFFFF1]OYU80151.1 MAG: TonB-dependent receptor [Flavobacterium sp. BFFFF1]